MRHAFPLLAALSLALVACDASTTSVAAPDPDPFYQGKPERPRIRLTVLAGTKAAPAAVARVRVEVRWPESWSQSADSGVTVGGGDSAWVVSGAAERMSAPLQTALFISSYGGGDDSVTFDFDCTGDSTGAFATPYTRLISSIPGGVDVWDGSIVTSTKAENVFVSVFCKG